MKREVLSIVKREVLPARSWTLELLAITGALGALAYLCAAWC